MNKDQKNKNGGTCLNAHSQRWPDAPPPLPSGKNHHNIASPSHEIKLYSDGHFRTSILMPSSDKEIKTETDKMVVSTNSAEEYDPGVAPGGYEAHITTALSSPLTVEATHGSLVVDVSREMILQIDFLLPRLANFFPFPHHFRDGHLQICHIPCLMKVMNLVVKGGHIMILWRVKTIQGIACKRVQFRLSNRLMHALPPQHVHTHMIPGIIRDSL